MFLDGNGMDYFLRCRNVSLNLITYSYVPDVWFKQMRTWFMQILILSVFFFFGGGGKNSLSKGSIFNINALNVNVDLISRLNMNFHLLASRKFQIMGPIFRQSLLSTNSFNNKKKNNKQTNKQKQTKKKKALENEYGVDTWVETGKQWYYCHQKEIIQLNCYFCVSFSLIQTFQENPELLRNMMGLIGNVAEVKHLRPQLLVHAAVFV